jgi:hypothetical protein
MDAPQHKKGSWLRRLFDRTARRAVDDAPAEISACEFECRKLECQEGEWESCPHRLRNASRDAD